MKATMEFLFQIGVQVIGMETTSSGFRVLGLFELLQKTPPRGLCRRRSRGF